MTKIQKTKAVLQAEINMMEEFLKHLPPDDEAHKRYPKDIAANKAAMASAPD